MIEAYDYVRVIRMPAGEAHVTDVEWRKGEVGRFITVINDGHIADDMINLRMIADAYRRDKKQMPNLIMPYLPGARQDRRKPGEALSSKVYADLINACGFEAVFCLDPHSDVMPAFIDNCVVVSIADLFNHGLFKKSLDDIKQYNAIIAPDAGASKRAHSVADVLGIPVYQATKHRDMATGRLSNFKCENLPADGKFLVVDDICDGGGTFFGLANAINVPPERLGLWVTHGIFSGKANEILPTKYGRVFTTNSCCMNVDLCDVIKRFDVFNLLIANIPKRG